VENERILHPAKIAADESVSRFTWIVAGVPQVRSGLGSDSFANLVISFAEQASSR